MATAALGVDAKAHPARWMWACAWLFCASAFGTVALQPLTNIDIAWHLLASREWVRGAVLYLEIRDPNLPAVWLLYRGFWWLSDATGLPAHRILFIAVALWGVLATLFAVLLLPRRKDDGWAGFATVVGVGLFLAAAALYQAGQRDYIISLSMLPYAAWIYRLSAKDDPAPRRFGALVTTLALLATLLKPYALGYILVMELWLCWRRRSLGTWLRWDLLVPVLVLALAVALQLLAYPAYLAFLEDWGRYYGNQGGTALTARVWCTIALLAGAVLWLVLKPRSGSWGQALVLLALGGFAVCALQNKWWDYHAFQFELFVELAWLVLLVEAWRDGLLPASLPIKAIRAGLAALVILWFGWIALLAAKQQKLMTLDRPPQTEVQALRSALDEVAGGRYVAFFGGLNAQISVYFSQARWGLSGPTLWVEGHLETALRTGSPEPDWLVEAGRRHYDDVLDRLQRGKPALLGFYYGSTQASQDFHAVYAQDPRIAALLESDYEFWRDIAGYHLHLLQD